MSNHLIIILIQFTIMIQLSKGGNINLAKEANGVTEFSIGLGWDIATQIGRAHV